MTEALGIAPNQGESLAIGDDAYEHLKSKFAAAQGEGYKFRQQEEPLEADPLNCKFVGDQPVSELERRAQREVEENTALRDRKRSNQQMQMTMMTAFLSIFIKDEPYQTKYLQQLADKQNEVRTKMNRAFDAAEIYRWAHARSMQLADEYDLDLSSAENLARSLEGKSDAEEILKVFEEAKLAQEVYRQSYTEAAKSCRANADDLAGVSPEIMSQLPELNKATAQEDTSELAELLKEQISELVHSLLNRMGMSRG